MGGNRVEVFVSIGVHSWLNSVRLLEIAGGGVVMVVMDVTQHNRRSWNTHAKEGSQWSVPVGAEEVARARAGDWRVILTPNRAVPAEWFGDIRNRDVLGLASGGGQQVPLFAAAGARVASFKNSDE